MNSYYKSKAGAVAVSFDGGDTVVVPSGRRVAADENVWVEVEGDHYAALSAPQVAACVAELEQAETASTYEAGTRERARAKAEAEARADAEYRARLRAFWASPEGQAEERRMLADLRAITRALMGVRK